MSDDLRRRILEDVASGALSPDEAAQRLRALDSPPGPEPEAEGVTEPARRIKVACTAGVVTVSGDADVHEAVATGEHTARREGDLLVIESTRDFSGFTFGAREFWKSRGEWSSGDDWEQWNRAVAGRGRGPWAALGEPLAVRVNPELPLEVEIAAGSVAVRDCQGPVRIDGAAGTITVERVGGPLEVSLASGKVLLEASLRRGPSKITCDLGKIDVRLAADSDVRVRAQAVVGKVEVPQHAVAGGVLISASEEVVVGEGTSTLELLTRAGAVSVTVAS